MSDHDDFAKKLPYPVTPLNIPGAYTTPPPPKGFDPMNASPAELVKHGVLLPRPGPGDPPALHAAWKEMVSWQCRAEGRIVPILEPQAGKTHTLGRAQQTNTGYTTCVWSGGIIETGTWTYVYGAWTIPTVSKPKEPQGQDGGWDSSSWVGIDGWNAPNEVLQAGIQQYVSPKGEASYVAWTEWWLKGGNTKKFKYINQSNIPNFPVTAGQSVGAVVQYGANNASGHLQMFNFTTGQNFNITLLPPTGTTRPGSSVEWIMEAPTGGEPKTALPKFTPVVWATTLGWNPLTKTSVTAKDGSYANILECPGTKPLTSVTLDNDSVTIKFIG